VHLLIWFSGEGTGIREQGTEIVAAHIDTGSQFPIKPYRGIATVIYFVSVMRGFF
jgi:hypothetical protein